MHFIPTYRRKERPISLVILVSCALLLTSCSSSRHVEWEYIVPDGYQGYLAIRWECPNGVPLALTNGIAHVPFTKNGTYCTSDSFFPSWSEQNLARSRSGQLIPWTPTPWETKGYAMCCGSTRGIGGGTWENPGPDMTFTVMWVGDMERVNASWPVLPDSGGEFFEQFGVRNMADYPDPR